MNAPNVSSILTDSESLAATHLNMSNEIGKPESSQGLQNNQTVTSYVDQMLIPVVAQITLENSQKLTQSEPTNAPLISEPTKTLVTVQESMKGNLNDTKTPIPAENISDKSITTIKPDTGAALHQSALEFTSNPTQLDSGSNKTQSMPNPSKLSDTAENITSQSPTNTSADGVSSSNKMPNSTEGVIEQSTLGMYQSPSFTSVAAEPQLDQTNSTKSSLIVPSALEIIPPIETTQTPFRAENTSTSETNATIIHSDLADILTTTQNIPTVTEIPQTTIVPNTTAAHQEATLSIHGTLDSTQVPVMEHNTTKLETNATNNHSDLDKVPTISQNIPNVTNISQAVQIVSNNTATHEEGTLSINGTFDPTQMPERVHNTTNLDTNATSNPSDSSKLPTAGLQNTASEINSGQSPSYLGVVEPLGNQSIPEGATVPNVLQSTPNTIILVLDQNQLSVSEQNIAKLDTNASNIHSNTSKPATAVLQNTASEINTAKSPSYSGGTEPLTNQSIPDGAVQTEPNSTIAVTQLPVKENITHLDTISTSNHSDSSKLPTDVLQNTASEINMGQSPSYSGVSEPIVNQSILEETKEPTALQSTDILDPAKLSLREQNITKVEKNEQSDLTKPPTVVDQSNATKIPITVPTVQNITTLPDVTKSPNYGMENNVPEPSKIPNTEQGHLELNTNHASTQSENLENESLR